MNFEEDIKNWVTIDNQIKKASETIKELRNKRSHFSTRIFSYAEENNLENAVIEISDGKLKFQQCKQTSPLTFRFLEECLNECIQNEDQVKQIIKFIKSKREYKYVSDIKRSYND
jgi:ferritin|tara:strand:- start:673 stop:1017 length:345 start_codon:yes stop_codon:yes gene_type:complete